MVSPFSLMTLPRRKQLRIASNEGIHCFQSCVHLTSLIHDEGNHLLPENVARILQIRVEHLGISSHILRYIHNITHLLHRE